MNRHKNKVVWITGASAGIGEGLARAFASEGSKLILSSRRIDELKRVKQSLNIPEADVLLLPLDLSDSSKMNELTEQVISKFGRIDILVNNGGISQRSLTMETSLEIDRRIMEINFFGTIALTKSVLPYMLKQKGGHIIVISSIAGKFGFFLRSAYSASKHALHGFFESLRMELYQDNIKVMIVCPGKIKTDISLNAITSSGKANNQVEESHVQGLSVEDCAHQILNGIEKNKEEIYVGGKELRSVWVKRFFPNLFSKLIRKQKPK